MQEVIKSPKRIIRTKFLGIETTLRCPLVAFGGGICQL